MGNAGSSGPPRERQKPGEVVPSSPYKEEQAFNFDRKADNKLVLQGSQVIVSLSERSRKRSCTLGGIID